MAVDTTDPNTTDPNTMATAPAVAPDTDNRDNTEPRTIGRRAAARIAGVGYLLLFGLAIFANFFVIESMVVDGDPTATAANITQSPQLFRLGLAAFLAIFLIDIVVAWALHLLLRSDHNDLSLAAAWSRLVYTVLLGVGAVFAFQALALYGSGSQTGSPSASPDVVGQVDRNVSALIALEQFNVAWMIGLAAFGIHLIVIGYLLARWVRSPRLLGPALMVAGVAYLIDTTAYTVLVDYAAHADVLLAMVAVPSVLAEGWFGLWLLTRAAR